MEESSNTQLARELLAKLTDKPIMIKTLQEVANESGIQGIEEYLGAVIETPEHILIALNENKPETHENSFVHEMLHKMLDYEGFPKVSVNQDYAKKNLPPNLQVHLIKLLSSFHSVIQHPEIYKRMREDYKLDMESYFCTLLAQKRKKFDKKKSDYDQQLIFSNQQDILDGLEYMYYNNNQKNEILRIFKDKSISAYNSCLGLHKAISKIGIHTPQSCLTAARKIKAHIIKYGDKRGLVLLNNMWKAIEIK